MGASIQEIERKLDTYRKKRTVRMWDGSEHETHLLPRTRFEVPEKENTTSYVVLEQVARKQHAAFRTQQVSTGLLLIGGPGCGKSIYSQVLESTSMIQGPLGQLGFGVRSTAKVLGQRLRTSPKASWLEFFKTTGKHDDAFLEALAGTNRLVPIIDGLDEVSPKELELIKSWLSQDKGIWIASSRPISRLDDFPNAKRVKFDELEQADATALFSLIGKPQFAKWWREQPHYKKTPIQTLGLTPLHLTMIAQAYDAPDALPSASDVYSRIFADWLDRAVREDRVDEETQERLRSLLPLFIGEIALHWLQAEEPYIERSLIDQQFEAAGISLKDRGPLLKALASVNLLLPDGDVYELGHRTFAEYAAACALRQRVARNNTVESELEELSFALQDGLLHKSKWKTLLTFYAPYIQHPHALLKCFIGVDSLRDPNIYFESTQSYEFGELWAFGIELVSQGRHWSSDEARATWSAALRLWLFASSHNAHFKLESLRPLGETLGRYLPKTLDGHIQLLGDEQQQKQLRDVGLELLDAMPATIHENIETQLLGSDLGKDEALKIMAWLKRLGCSPTEDGLEALLERWAEDSTVSSWVWALCLIKSPHLLDGRIVKMLRQGDFSSSELIGLWLVAEVPSNFYKATEHYKIRRDAMDLLLEGDMPWNFHQHVGKLSQEALDEIIGRLWKNTPPQARGAIEDLLRNSKRIPTKCQVGDVIPMYLNDKGVHENDGILSMMEWFKDHQDDLRTYLRDASGEHKFAAVVLLAYIEQEFETEALAKHLHEA
ncbi:MAG: hypothetical protein VYB06_06650, partial [Cyanobacteriota bacterium]|nr:hypothetical protein [Cyanobacteriota bacterium]